jgi:hypothetical protein
MTIFASSSNARTFDYQGGDIGYVPASFGTPLSRRCICTLETFTCAIGVGHYVENTGNTTLHYLEIFNTGELFDCATMCYSIEGIAQTDDIDRFQDISLTQVKATYDRVCVSALITDSSGLHLRLRSS